MRVKLCSALAALALSTAPAFGDAAWTSNLGPVVYDVDAGDTVVLMHFTPGSGAVRRTFLPGLAGNLDHRGTYSGYWVEGDDTVSSTPICDVSIIDAEGNVTAHWGRVEFVLINTDLPAAWDAQVGYCFETPTTHWSGRDNGDFDYEAFERRRNGSPK